MEHSLLIPKPNEPWFDQAYVHLAVLVGWASALLFLWHHIPTWRRNAWIAMLRVRARLNAAYIWWRYKPTIRVLDQTPIKVVPSTPEQQSYAEATVQLAITTRDPDRTEIPLNVVITITQWIHRRRREMSLLCNEDNIIRSNEPENFVRTFTCRMVVFDQPTLQRMPADFTKPHKVQVAPMLGFISPMEGMARKIKVVRIKRGIHEKLTDLLSRN